MDRGNHAAYFILLLLLLSCKQYGDFWDKQKTKPFSNTPFALTVVNPPHGAMGVATNANISVAFNRPFDGTSVGVQSIAGACSGSVQLSFDNFTTCVALDPPAFNAANDAMVLTPTGGLLGVTAYTLRILTTLLAADGMALAATVDSTFDTAATPDTTPPSSPSSPSTTTVSTAEIALSWAAAIDDTTPTASLEYEICRSSISGGCTLFTVFATSLPGATAYNDTGLSPLTAYYYQIRTKDIAGNTSAPTAEITATTQALGAVVLQSFNPAPWVYMAPQNVTLTASPAGATICYTEDTSTPSCLLGICGGLSVLYTGSISVNSGTKMIKAAACMVGYTDAVPQQGSYTIDNIPPDAPGSTSVSPINIDELKLTWNTASDNYSAAGTIFYEICQSSSSGGCTSFTVAMTTPPGATSQNVTGLLPLTTYYFSVRAIDEAGNRSTPSAEFSGTTLSLGTIATPQFSPPAGTYIGAQNVTITTATPLAVLCYTTNGSTPACLAGLCTTGSTYSNPVTISTTNTTLKALGCMVGSTNSSVESGTYTIN